MIDMAFSRNLHYIHIRKSFAGPPVNENLPPLLLVLVLTIFHCLLYVLGVDLVRGIHPSEKRYTWPTAAVENQ